MPDLKRAFGTPDAEFHERVRQTLFRIEEKEEKSVKKKLTISMAAAFALCLMVCIVSAFAASDLITSERPDTTQFPLSPGAQATPATDEAAVYYHSEDGSPYGIYYHSIRDCSGITGAVPVTADELSALGKTACPQCLPDRVYMTADDIYYHLFVNCALCPDHPDAFTLAEADDLGMRPCPECVQQSVYFQYGRSSDSCYHASRSCAVLLQNGVASYAPGTVVQAKTKGRTACSICTDTAALTPTPAATSTLIPMPTATAQPVTVIITGSTVYIGADGMRYHYLESCSAAAGELQKTYESTALASGQIACSECIPCWYEPSGDAIFHSDPGCDLAAKRLSSFPAGTLASQADIAACAECVRWMTDDGIYFHIDPACSGMKDAYPSTAEYAVLTGKTACPSCMDAIWDAESAVSYQLSAYYAAKDDTYYHLDPDCIDPNTETLLSEEQIILRISTGELAPCPVCAHSLSRTVLFSDEDDCYHTVTSCANLVGQTRLMSQADAIAAGRSACVECLYCHVSASDRSVFHMDPRCSSAPDLEAVFAIDAVAIGSQPCTECVYWAADDEAVYHTVTGCLAAYAVQYTPCSLEYAQMTGRTLCMDCQEVKTVSDGGLLLSTSTVYRADGESSLYHLYTSCPGEDNAFPMLLADALNEGRVACESCLTIYTHSFPGQTSVLYEGPLTDPQPNPSSQTITLTFEATGFQEGLHSIIPVSQDKWVCDSLTIHSLVALSTRAGIYLEAEYTLDDPAIDPESIRMTYYCEGYGSFGWDSALVTPIAYEDGGTGYILQTVIPKMSLPETAAEADIGGKMALRAYGKTTDDQSEIMFSFQ